MQEVKFTPENIAELQPNEVICGGTNELGKHGAALAKVMNQKWGMPWGKAEGHYGQSYGLPTKATPWRTLPLEGIKVYVDRYIQYCAAHPEFTFLTTKIGCGKAGLTPEQIAPMFFAAIFLDNVLLPEEFFNIIKAKCDAIVEKHFPTTKRNGNGLFDKMDVATAAMFNEYWNTPLDIYSIPKDEVFGEDLLYSICATEFNCIDAQGVMAPTILSFPQELMVDGRTPFKVRDLLVHKPTSARFMVVATRSYINAVDIRTYNPAEKVTINPGDTFIWGKREVPGQGVEHNGVQPKEYVDTAYVTTPDNGEPYKPVNFFPPGEGHRSILNPDYVPKPVVGAMPQWRWIELRVDHLQEAIQRYKDASQSVPVDIEAELTEHQAWLKQYGPK